MFIRKTAKSIINSINNNPEIWDTDYYFSGRHYLLINKKNKIAVWVCNGFLSVALSKESSIKGDLNIFNIFEKRAIYKAYKKWLSKKIIESLNK